MAGARTGSLSDNPFPTNSAISNNWNGYDSGNSGETVLSQLEDFSNKIFRPTSGSEMAIMGAGAYTVSQTGTSPNSGANYDPSTYYCPWQQARLLVPLLSVHVYDAVFRRVPPVAHHVSPHSLAHRRHVGSDNRQCSTERTRAELGIDCQSADAGHYVNTVGQPARPHAGRHIPASHRQVVVHSGVGRSVHHGHRQLESEQLLRCGEYSDDGGATGCTPCRKASSSLKPAVHIALAEGGQYVTGTGNTGRACAAGHILPHQGCFRMHTMSSRHVPAVGSKVLCRLAEGPVRLRNGQHSHNRMCCRHLLPSSGGASACTPVPADHYQDRAGMSWYTSCPTNEHWWRDWINSSSDCS